MATLGEGFKVGHWTDEGALTGCTVVLPPPGNVTSCDIRGSSPGSRELTLLDTERRLTEVHAILLTGGSAFGLAAADGVVEWCSDNGIGYETRIARVPIVPAAVVFDLGTGDPSLRPGPREGRAACEDARSSFATGRIGAGTGTTVGKWAGFEYAVPGGLGAATAERGGLAAHALAVVNAVGDVCDEDGTAIAGTTSPSPRYFPPLPEEQEDEPIPGNTVLVVVTVTADLEKRDVKWLAGRGSDGVTRSVRPAHTRYDGDVTFAVAAPGGGDAGPFDLDLLGVLAADAAADAVRDAVRSS